MACSSVAESNQKLSTQSDSSACSVSSFVRRMREERGLEISSLLSDAPLNPRRHLQMPRDLREAQEMYDNGDNILTPLCSEFVGNRRLEQAYRGTKSLLSDTQSSGI